MKNIILLFASINLLSLSITGQIFTELTSIDLKHVYYGACSWGDYDNDGDLDIILTGSTYSGFVYLYENDGGGQFTEKILEDVPYSEHGKIDFVDYDNDGFLDIMITGRGGENGSNATIYRNNKNGGFQHLFMINVGYGAFSSFDFGDTDGDGDIDIVNSGIFYINHGDNIFKEKEDGGIGIIHNGSVALGDYDNDGDLDLLLTGDNGWPDYSFSKVYKNIGNNDFLPQDDIILEKASMGDAQWGDYDGDGDLDIILSGFIDNPISTVSVYRNDGNNNFEKINISDVRSPFTAWGDYNNDGLLDFIVSYRNDGSFLYKNMGNDSFEKQTSENIPGDERGDFRWGDYDNDGDLDFVITDRNYTKLYTNNTLEANLKPFAPTALSTYIDSSSAVLSWSKGNDENTPLSSLSYAVNLIRGIDEEIISSFSLDDGYRKIVRHGAIQGDTFLILKDLKPGGYKWRVQSIDNGYLGSEFSITNSFYIGKDVPVVAHSPKLPVIDSNSTSLEVLIMNIGMGNMQYEISQLGDWFSLSTNNGDDSTVVVVNCDENLGSYRKGKIILNFIEPDYPQYVIEIAQIGSEIFSEVFEGSFPGLSYCTSSWGDYDNDLDLDLLITGEKNSNQYLTELYINNLENGFVKDDNFEAPQLSHGYSCWHDYNNDGNVDLLISGETHNYPENPLTKIYKNSGSNTLIEDAKIELPGFYWSSAAFGDYNNNGRSDLVIHGQHNNNELSSIYINLSDSSFMLDSLASLLPLWGGNSYWVDLNYDSKLDILQSGHYSDTWSANIYTNNGNGTLDENQLQKSVHTSWGDFNNDGDIDICLNGRIYLHDMINGYILNEQSNLPWITNHDWGDYDNDGDLDIILSSNRYTRLYENLGNAVFKPTEYCNFSELFTNIVQFVDFDNDGKLDILLTNTTSTRLYKNNYYIANQDPEPPGTLLDSTWSDYVYMNWDKGSDNESGTTGLCYNGYLYKENGDTIWNSMSDKNTGFLKSIHRGNTNKNNNWMINLEQPGDYFWSVQSIDQGFIGSTFASEKQFSITEFLAFDDTMHNAHFQVMKNNTIYWEEAFLEFVKLEYSLDNGTSWQLICDSIIADEELYIWNVPHISPRNLLLKISDNQHGLFDTASINFIPYIEIMSPLDSMRFQPNKNMTINWKSEFSNYLQLEYTKADEINYTKIEDSIPSSLETFSWQIPIVSPSDYIIKITDMEYPEANFSVYVEFLSYIEILTPTANEVLVQNTNYDIEWDYIDLENISIKCVKDNGSYICEVANNIPAIQYTYAWEVPYYVNFNESYKLIIRDNLGNVSDTSSVFSIVSAIDEFPKSEGFTAYPNPCDNTLLLDFNFEHKSCDVKLYDLMGNMLKRKVLVGSNNKSLELSDIKPGVYVLKAILDNNTSQQLIIKAQ